MGQRGEFSGWEVKNEVKNVKLSWSFCLSLGEVMKGGVWRFEGFNETSVYSNEVFLTPVLVLPCCKTWVISCSAGSKADVVVVRSSHHVQEQNKDKGHQTKIKTSWLWSYN